MSLCADSFDDELDTYFNKIKDDQTSSIQSFNNLKMLYLDAILRENNLKQFKVLDKLLKASSIVGFEVPNSYKSDFSKLRKKLNKGSFKDTKLKQINKQIKKIKKSKKIKESIEKNTKVNKLIYAKKENDKIYLKWTKKLNKNQIKNHIWSDKGFSYNLYDISNAHLDMKTREVSLKSGTIQIGQYKKDTIRIVYKSKIKRKLTLSLQDKTMQIYFKNATKKNSKKTSKTYNVQTKKESIPKYRIAYKNKDFKNKIIIIDPGHGGKDPGAISGKIKEKYIVLKVSKYLVQYLKEMDIKVYMTRNRDKFIELKQRTKIANNKKADLFISIHVNSSNKKHVQGIETYFLSPKSSDKSKKVALRENSLGVKSLGALSKNVLLSVVNRSKLLQSNKLAIDVQRNLLNTTKLNSYNIKDHGVRGGPFWILVGARMPNVLVELGYLTNRAEAKRLMSTKYQRTLAKGIARGIEAYLEKN